MAYSRVLGLVVSFFDAVFRPSEFVATTHQKYVNSRFEVVKQVVNLSIIYSSNLALYAGPLTLAGFGIQAGMQPPPESVVPLLEYFGEPNAVWELGNGFVLNSVYITFATVIALLTFHVGVLLTWSSEGVLQSIHTVVYSTSAYLAGIFTAVWYISTTPATEALRTFILNLQKALLVQVNGFLGGDYEVPGGAPDGLTLGHLSSQGTVVLAVLILLLLYFLYSLYLGARINHRMTRSSAGLALVSVCLSPLIYAAGLVVYSSQFGGII